MINAGKLEEVDDAQPKETKVKESPPLMYWLKQRVVYVNLIAMAITWTSVVFNFFMIGFMVNTLDQIYMSAIASNTADVISYFLAGLLY